MIQQSQYTRSSPMHLKITTSFAIFCACCCLGQAQSSAPKTKFSGRTALAYTVKAAGFGQRPSGSEAIAKLRTWIVAEVKRTGADVTLDSFTAFTPAGNVQMANIIGRFPGSSGKAIVITGHYDTKRMPLVNFIGANDAGSSTGFLMELAATLAHEKRKDDVYLVWFDGEEAVGQWSASDSVYGSRHLAEKWAAAGMLPKIKALINVDMIADKNLDIVQDSNSSASLRKLVWQTAEQLGYGRYFLKAEGAIDDDHVPFVTSGVNAMDLIDFNDGPNNSYWHTDKDTTDKLSARSLQIVGDVVVKSIAALEAQ
jgi:Zn-dependent M28 family amino/carboxypeptidase